MSDFAQRLASPVWTGSGVEDHDVDSPTWSDTEVAIRGLDGDNRTEVYLHPHPAELMLLNLL